MKRILLFILPILIIVAVGFAIFGIAQVRLQDEKLMDDLKRKAKAVGESIELSAKYILINNDLRSANRLVESFQKRERLQGSVIYDKEGRVLAVTERIADWKEKDKPYIKEILAEKKSRGILLKYKEYSVYSYIIPVLDDEGNFLGLVEVIYDTSYLFTMLADLWRSISITLIMLLALVTVVTLLIQWQMFVLPVRRLTQWFTHFQRGDTEKLKPFEELNRYGEYKVDFIGHLIELMIKMEKNTPPEKPARVFRELMDAMIQEKEIFVVVSKATQIG